MGSGAAAPEHPLPPLTATDDTLRLVVQGQADSELLVPLGVRSAQPVVVAILPSGDVKQACLTLGQAIRKRAFVLCLTTDNERLPVTAAAAELNGITAALKLGLRTVKRKFGRYVQSEELTIVGLGDAAELVVPIVRQAPEVFRRVALIQGGFGLWSAVDSAQFVSAGGKAILTVCGEPSCRSEAMRVAATAKAAGAASRLEPEIEPATDAKTDRRAGASAGAPGSARHRGLDTAAACIEWLLDATPTTAGVSAAK